MTKKQKKYTTSLFLFRRDLRLDDNTGLLFALEQSEKVIACFIFDPRQVKENKYKSNNAIQFMIESLEDLDMQLKKHTSKLFLYYGETHKVVRKLIKQEDINQEKEKIDAIFLNRDYTPFSKKRDEALKKICREHNVAYHSCADLLLHEPEEVKKDNEKPYTIFTPFFKKALLLNLKKSQKNKHIHYFKEKTKKEQSLNKEMYEKVLPQSKRNKKSIIKGGRAKALNILKELNKHVNYDKEKDIPYKQATTYLSAHLKFGTISVREAYEHIQKSLGPHHPLLRQLFWRDFFTHIAFHFPHVFGESFYKKYDAIVWKHSAARFKAWCEGKTGFPIVDAGMRELNTTGYMHNRVRMITASFLVKDLHIDWRKGEQYFAQKLIDYDPCVNNGNWQWAASTGCDAVPYFRIFNPWNQQKRFDLDCEYIKQWIPELQDLTPKQIHDMQYPQKQKPLLSHKYPKPIVDHKQESQRTKEMYKGIVN